VREEGGELVPAAPRQLLIVCHANTARSVMAQVLLERMLADRGAEAAMRVRSAGIAPYARDGMIPSLDARLALREAGIHLDEDAITSTDLRRHRHLAAEADLILTMTEAQKQMLSALGEARGRTILTLRELAGEGGDIDDPAMQGEAVFRACLAEIRRCLERSLDRLLAGGSSPREAGC
jgi:protein-tyrosine-phosphatase